MADEDEWEVDHGSCEWCGETLTESPDDCSECGWTYEEAQDAAATGGT